MKDYILIWPPASACTKQHYNSNTNLAHTPFVCQRVCVCVFFFHFYAKTTKCTQKLWVLCVSLSACVRNSGLSCGGQVRGDEAPLQCGGVVNWFWLWAKSHHRHLHVFSKSPPPPTPKKDSFDSSCSTQYMQFMIWASSRPKCRCQDGRSHRYTTILSIYPSSQRFIFITTKLLSNL